MEFTGGRGNYQQLESDHMRTTSNADGTSYTTEHVDERDKLYDDEPQIEVNFESVYKQPKNLIVVKEIRACQAFVFDWLQIIIYNGLSVVVGTLLAIVFALVFAFTNFMLTWLVFPTSRLFIYFFSPVFAIWRTIMRCLLDPVFQSCGLLYNNVAGRFRVHVSGVNKAEHLVQRV